VPGLTVLLTNTHLEQRGGTELYVRDLATALARLGHTPLVYSPRLGAVAEEIRALRIPVVDTLDALDAVPDIIHGQHHLETMTALWHFPQTPALVVSHGFLPWQEAPPRFPRILRYVVVGVFGRARLTRQFGIDPARITVVPNFVDLARFRPRGALPPRPRRALLFGNWPTAAYRDAVGEACAARGIALDMAGAGLGPVTDCPEALLPEYDLVFAVGRSALEAMATGAAVILASPAGLGPLVTTSNLARLRAINFALRALTQPCDQALIGAAIDQYDPVEAMLVSATVRQTAGLEEAAATFEALYEDVVSEWRATRGDPMAEGRATAAYLRWLSQSVLPGLSDDLQVSETERARLEAENAELWAALWQARHARLPLPAEPPLAGGTAFPPWAARAPRQRASARPRPATNPRRMPRRASRQPRPSLPAAVEPDAGSAAAPRPATALAPVRHGPVLICLLPVRNGEADLPGYFASVARFADGIVALDDGSTDRTREILEACPLVKILLTNPVRERYTGWDDAANRNRLLAAAADLEPQWILSLDADERIPADDAAALRAFLQTDALPELAYGFKVYRMWQDLGQYDRASLWVYRLFAWAPGQQFPDQRLHLVPVPTEIPRERWLRTTIRIQHLAGLTQARRIARFAKYEQADPEDAFQQSYRDLLELPGAVAPWRPRPPELPILLRSVHGSEGPRQR
jgi:glycosyltransferase involved in cell wall biosynthesis